MVLWIAGRLERYFNIPSSLTIVVLRRLIVGSAAAAFVCVATITLAFDSIAGFNSISSLKVGDLAPENIVAPPDKPPFVSPILTEQARQEARDSVLPVYDPADPDVARQQTQLARQILDFIENVRRDSYATSEQKADDLHQILAVTLSDTVVDNLLRLDEETWQAIDDEIINVLPRIMRESIRETNLQTIREQLPTQVSVRFNPQEREIVVAIVEDLVRPNTFANPEKTAIAQANAANAVQPVERSFGRGQIIVFKDQPITPLDYEALQALGLLTPNDLRFEIIGRSLLASIIVMVVIGLYIARFESQLIYSEPRLLTLLAALFLVMLIAVRIFGASDNSIYLFPTAALALVYVAISSPQVAFITSIGLSLLVGMMTRNSLEVATMVATGGILGTLALRRPERFNNFFVAGLLVGFINTAVVAVFRLGQGDTGADTLAPTLLSLLNGILFVPTVAFAIMYLLTAFFNLPTPLKLLDLSQPSKPLLQRLLREAPGTYQHSLQVANLAEQAATAIGANAQLVHVAALYHDIGKMLNPVFFSENQQDIANPHDALNDPYRSADIIITHVTGGDDIAKQYRLPMRLRDFIREHHGTTQVYVFYQRAIEQAGGDASAVDPADFTYPGPKPRSRETAILMMADSCESAVRAMKPQSRQEISDMVRKIIEDKRTSGQLDESNLTLNELKTIQTIFIELLQAVFHPRIDYREAVNRSRPKETTSRLPKIPKSESKIPKVSSDSTIEMPIAKAKQKTIELPVVPTKEELKADLDEEQPLPDVPPLPRANKRSTSEINGHNETQKDKAQTPPKDEQ